MSVKEKFRPLFCALDAFWASPGFPLVPKKWLRLRRDILRCKSDDMGPKKCDTVAGWRTDRDMHMQVVCGCARVCVCVCVCVCLLGAHTHTLAQTFQVIRVTHVDAYNISRQGTHTHMRLTKRDAHRPLQPKIPPRRARPAAASAELGIWDLRFRSVIQKVTFRTILANQIIYLWARLIKITHTPSQIHLTEKAKDSIFVAKKFQNNRKCPALITPSPLYTFTHTGTHSHTLTHTPCALCDI